MLSAHIFLNRILNHQLRGDLLCNVGLPLGLFFRSLLASLLGICLYLGSRSTVLLCRSWISGVAFFAGGRNP